MPVNLLRVHASKSFATARTFLHALIDCPWFNAYLIR